MKKVNICAKLVGVTILMLMTGLLLMIVAYTLPVGRMKNNIADSHEVFNYEGTYPQIIQGYKSTQLDNYTDALMYATAIHPGSGNAVKDAMYNARYEYVDNSMPQSLNDYANDVVSKEELRYEIGYSRYWHGYLAILKPLLLFFNVSEIRMLNMVLQFLLTCLLLYLVRKKIGEQYQIPILAMLMVLNPLVLPLSLQFSGVFYVGLLGAIGILLLKRTEDIEKYILWFWLLGMLTSYVDLLTYPVFTYGLPLIILLLYNRQHDWKKSVVQIIEMGIFWGAGYSVMWVGKWILAWILGSGNIFKEVMEKIMFRTSMTGEEMEGLNVLSVLGKNISVITKLPYILLFLLALIICVMICRKYSYKRNLSSWIPYLIVMVIPMIWLVIKSNHSWVHYWFTYRELSITVLAVFVGFIECGLIHNRNEE